MLSTSNKLFFTQYCKHTYLSIDNRSEAHSVMKRSRLQTSLQKTQGWKQ